MTKIRFVYEYRPTWARKDYYDVVYKNRVCTFCDYNDVPMTARLFMAQSFKDKTYREQYDTLYKCNAVVYEVKGEIEK